MHSSQSRELVFPTLFRVAMDVLPVQASSVACERVFSLCKEADTIRRRRMSPKMMEMTQMLKHSFKREAGELLSLTQQWQPPSERELDGTTTTPVSLSHAARMDALLNEVEEGCADDNIECYDEIDFISL